MGYKELYATAKKDKDLRALGATYVEFKNKGDRVIGKMLSKNSVRSSAGEGTYNQYMFDTDDGIVKFAMGSATDNEAGALMAIGGVYSVEFKGQEKLKGGHRLNKFVVEEITAPPEGAVGGQSDIPF